MEGEWNHMDYAYDREITRRYMLRHLEVDGVFASDVQAFGCMRPLWEAGIRIPEKLKIVDMTERK